MRALFVSGAEIVSHQRHHSLADTNAHVEREALDLEHDADGGQGQIVIGNHQLVDDHVVQIEQKRRYRRGDAHSEHAEHVGAAREPHFGRKRDRRSSSDAQQNEEEIEKGHAVGKAGGDTGAKHFIAVRQQHEHEQGVEGDVQKPAEYDADTGLLGKPDAADQVGQHIG